MCHYNIVATTPKSFVVSYPMNENDKTYLRYALVASLNVLQELIEERPDFRYDVRTARLHRSLSGIA